MSQNQDPERVGELVQAVREANENIMDKELRLIRLREYEHLLYQEFDVQNQLNEERFKQEIEAEVEKATEELRELKGFFESAEEAKSQWEAEDTRLRGIVEANNAEGSDATEAKKTEDQEALDDHQDTK